MNKEEPKYKLGDRFTTTIKYDYEIIKIDRLPGDQKVIYYIDYGFTGTGDWFSQQYLDTLSKI